ncbi:hypothetical protein QRX60_09165 [Amycolatopsis mongoliensis]|uniref:Uncharacterized protein n=1 Tax=Amycolatopsis mongoliensis TaxID=715475 RepID=A0A9Y2JVC7_9PSEU|nr:hypothetical protein [Amycolatopsis sp. 4-36]WIY04002.1 hypothetical protein QRX60_09165 [Amycolatopsis sp. 4-36]
MSSTANARRSAPAQPALTAGESPARAGTPRPWAAALQRPAAKILVAGGLTVAGWLLTAALSGNTASAAETASCPDAPAVSTVDHSAKLFAHGKHHKSHREAVAPCAQPGEGSTADESPAGDTETPDTETQTETKTVAKQSATESTKDTQTAEEPAAEPAATTKATSSGGLLGGLVGGVLNVVGGTLNTVTTTVNGTLSTVGAVTDTLSHTILAPLTQPPAGHPEAPALLPLDDILSPILNGGSNSGGVTVTVPGLVVGSVTQPTTPAVAETAPAAAPAATVPQTSRVAVGHLIEQQNTLAAKQEQPRDSGVHATGGGGDSTPGLPGGTSAPSAPAPTAAPGHDGPGGARNQFAVHTDDVTTTQLKLIGASRDHDVDGAGREAALPTTSPD